MDLPEKLLTGIQIAGHIVPAPHIPFLYLAISQPILGLISKIKVF
jgi:hypothetical protein